jgi:hypothetical protein
VDWLKISLINILLIEKYFCKIIFTALSNIYSMVFNTIQRRMGWIDWKELFGILWDYFRTINNIFDVSFSCMHILKNSLYKYIKNHNK